MCVLFPEWHSAAIIGQSVYRGRWSLIIIIIIIDSAIAQAVSRWLSTAADRVQSQAEHVGFVVDKVALEQVFSEYFGFPCKSSFHQLLHHHNHPGPVQ
jgi:hypothetical protein